MKQRNKIGHGNLTIISSALFMIFSFQISATTYYVSNNGTDLNSGTSPSSSWQTLNKVNGFVFQAGDSILFKRDDVWREQLIPQSGDSTGHLYYGAYGIGNKPIILGSADMSGISNWINKGNNIWSSATAASAGIENILNPSFTNDANNWIFYSQGNAVANGGRDTVDFASSPASYKINCTANGDNLDDMQFSTQNLSITYGKTYHLTFKAKCSSQFQLAGVLLMKSTSPYNMYFSGSVIPPVIDTNWATFTIHFTSVANANDAMIDFFLGNAIPDNSTFFIDDISFQEIVLNSPVTTDVGNVIFNNAASFGVKKWSPSDLQAQGDFWYDSDSICLKLYSSANPGLYYNNIECALSKNIIDEQDKHYIIYENLALKYGSAHGIGGGNTHHIIITGCDISFIGGGGIYIPPYGVVRYGNGIEFWGSAQNNMVEQCKIWEIYDAAITNQNEGSVVTQSNIIYRNNLINNAEWSYEYWNRPAGSITQNIFFINNTCLYAGETWAHNQRPDKRGRHLNFFQNDATTNNFYVLNNIFYEATSAGLYVLRYSDLDSFNLDYNDWYQTINDTLIDIRWGMASVNVYTMSQFSNYQNTYFQDTHSIAAYPLFADTINGNYQILVNSPCIDSGTPDTTGIPVGQNDLSGNNRVQDGDGIAQSIIDIGCYEQDFNVGILNHDFLNEPRITVFPNPTNNSFTIQIKNWSEAKVKNREIQIYDIAGQVVFNSIFTSSELAVNPELESGMYLLQLMVGEKMLSKKLIIQH